MTDSQYWWRFVLEPPKTNINWSIEAAAVTQAVFFNCTRQILLPALSFAFHALISSVPGSLALQKDLKSSSGGFPKRSVQFSVSHPIARSWTIDRKTGAFAAFNEPQMNLKISHFYLKMTHVSPHKGSTCLVAFFLDFLLLLAAPFSARHSGSSASILPYPPLSQQPSAWPPSLNPRTSSEIFLFFLLPGSSYLQHLLFSISASPLMPEPLSAVTFAHSH